MNKAKTVKELDEVIDFIHRFDKFVKKYGEWLQDYPPFGNGDNRGKLDAVSQLLNNDLWYLEQVRNHHWHCDSCGKSFKFVDLGRYVVKCRCGGELWLCTYKPPSERCDTCQERFKCLTENKWKDKLVFRGRVREPDLSKIESMDNYKVMAEF